MLKKEKNNIQDSIHKIHCEQKRIRGHLRRSQLAHPSDRMIHQSDNAIYLTDNCNLDVFRTSITLVITASDHLKLYNC